MEYIKLNSVEDFDNAVLLIEGARPSEEYKFSKKGVVNKNPAQIPYTTYNRDMLEIEADEFVLTLLGLNSITYVSSMSYTEWEKRFDAVASLKKLVAESPISVDLGGGIILPLKAMIETWYTSKSTQVSDFIKSGDSAFYDSIQSADDFWWDIEREEGTVREQALSAVEGLII